MCLVPSQQGHAQSLSNLKELTIKVEESMLIDSLLIVPGSEIIRKHPDLDLIAKDDYQIEYGTSKLTWNKMPDCDSIRILYRHFPSSLSRTYSKKDPQLLYDFLSGGTEPLVYNTGTKDLDLFDLEVWIIMEVFLGESVLEIHRTWWSIRSSISNWRES